MPATIEKKGAILEKRLRVRRSNQTSDLYWWSLPVSLSTFARIFSESLREHRALVQPVDAKLGIAEDLEARPLPDGTLLANDVAALFQASEANRVHACSIAFFPSTCTDADLVRSAERMRENLDLLDFTLAIAPEHASARSFRFCFRVPGQVIQILEHLALDRSFGAHPVRIEMALLRGLELKPNQEVRLRLVMERGEAELIGVDRAGCRRVHYLESGKGYTGISEEMKLSEVIQERLQESWRKFPVGVFMFAGLPFFLGAFWAKNTLFRREARKPRTHRAAGSNSKDASVASLSKG